MLWWDEGDQDNDDDDAGEADHPANEHDEDAAKLGEGELSACARLQLAASSTLFKTCF